MFEQPLPNAPLSPNEADVMPVSQAAVDALQPSQPHPDATTAEQFIYDNAYRLAKTQVDKLLIQGQLRRARDINGKQADELAEMKVDKNELQAENDSLTNLAYLHEVSGLPNKRAFQMELDERIARGQDLAIAFLDLDKFKLVNDTHGHGVGDEVLRRAAEIIQDSIVELTYRQRADDFVSHFSGDEFGAILDLSPRSIEALTSEERMEAIKNKICRSIDDYAQERDMKSLGLSVSIGIVRHLPGETSEQTIARADAAMYAHKAAKKKGRNDPPRYG